MGTVYLAQQISMDRTVALKVLSKELAAKPAFVQRFLREARVMARLDHPHILRCFEVREERGWHILAMEYVDGGSLENWLQKLGKFSLADATHVFLACASALQHAHDQHLIHRDIKPDNILLTSKGVVKMADLGLAKALDENLDLTKTGTGAGTPLYMAPEQARDVKHVDGRSDLYALGVTYYRLLTGKLPFAGETLLEVITAKEKGKFTPARQLNDEVPPRLDLILDKMLAAKPEHRYQTCQQVITAVKELGVAGDSLSFMSPRAATPAKGKAAALTRQAGSALRPTAGPAPVTLPPEPEAPAEKEAGDHWYVNLKMPNGKTIRKQASYAELTTLIKSGSLPADTRVSRTLNGEYRPVATYPEFGELVRGLAVKAQVDQKAHKYRDMFSKIVKEDERRRRWRWVNNQLSRVGGFLGFLLWLGVVVGFCTGAFFVFRWLLEKTQ
jgi:serine/threonine-protein kinase